VPGERRAGVIDDVGGGHPGIHVVPPIRPDRAMPQPTASRAAGTARPGPGAATPSVRG
jgi:hypothetical protein